MSAAATASSAAVKPVRRFPPPCWTQDEALALIQAYRERWYALRRGYLRTNDWDAVAEEVGRVCPGASPPKTSAQCRHKMEKLRQRYRAEKQRALSFPGGRFLSTWFYFEAMDAMENNSNRSNSDEEHHTGNDLVNSDVKLVNFKNNQQLNTNLGSVHVGLNPGRGIRFKPAMADQNSVTIAARSNNSRVTNNYAEPEEEDDDDDDEFEQDGYQIETPIGQNSRKIPNFSSHNYATVFHPDHQINDNAHFATGFRAKPSNLQDSEHPVFRPRKISKIDSNYWEQNGADHVNNGEGEVWMKMGKDRGSASMEISRNYSEKFNKNSNNNGDNGGMTKNDAIGQMVSSIKLLADGFVKMEKMKMDMAREIEKMRMEAEMKRNEMILESQKQIVEAFVKGLAENKKQQQHKTEEV